MKKHNTQYKNKHINRHPAKQNWNNKKNCYSYHSSSKRSLSPFWFQLLTIVSSFIGTDFYHRQLAVFRIAKIKITIVTLITIHITLFKLLSILHLHFWYSDLSFLVWGPWVCDVLKCLDNFLCFTLGSRTSPFRKHSVLFFSVWAYREQCVHLYV